MFYLKCDPIHYVVEQDVFLHNNQSMDISEDICFHVDVFFLHHVTLLACTQWLDSSHSTVCTPDSLITSMWCVQQQGVQELTDLQCDAFAVSAWF